METVEVTVDERVPRLRLVGSALGQPEEPTRVVPPRVLLEEVVLGRGLRLDVAPGAVQDVPFGLDQLPSLGNAASVHFVRGHGAFLPRPRHREAAIPPRPIYP